MSMRMFRPRFTHMRFSIVNAYLSILILHASTGQFCKRSHKRLLLKTLLKVKTLENADCSRLVCTSKTQTSKLFIRIVGGAKQRNFEILIAHALHFAT